MRMKLKNNIKLKYQIVKETAIGILINFIKIYLWNILKGKIQYIL